MPGSVLENINDPPIPAPDHHAQSAPLLQPIQVNLPLKPGVQADGADLTVTLHPVSAGPDSISQDIVQFLHAEFSAEILNGCTYPMEEPMSLDKFRDYWFGTFAVVVLKGEKDETEKLLRGQTISSLVTGSGSGSRNWKDLCLGTFYIKPNYPGFLTCSAARGRGIGSVMGQIYLDYAPKLGYKYSVFNLVFANNPASSKIWDRLGFQVLGRVPGAGRLANSEELVDALIYGRCLV